MVLDDLPGVVLLVFLFEFVTQGNVNWLSAARTTVFAVAFFVIAPFVAKPFLMLVKRWHSLIDVPSLVPTMVVALMLLFAALTHAFGAPEVLGEFAAGFANSRRFFLPIGTVL